MAAGVFQQCRSAGEMRPGDAEALQNYPNIALRMGVHSGPINPISRTSMTAPMLRSWNQHGPTSDGLWRCGHILVSRRLAEDLEQYRQWQPYFQTSGM